METTRENKSQSQSQGWRDVLAGEKEKPYFQHILGFLKQARVEGKTIYPAQENIFNALKFTDFSDVKVVILGQDPYHGPRQAHGLCFSVQPGVPAPPSLQNIFQEIHDDLALPIPNHGCLEAWARQGVLLLNTVLTVFAHQAHSHANIGWERFTDRVIQLLNDKQEGLIFMLWGSQAQRKLEMIDPTRHYILKSSHPSPLSAYRGFLGCRHFSKANALLQKMNKTEIDWQSR